MLVRDEAAAAGSLAAHETPLSIFHCAGGGAGVFPPPRPAATVQPVKSVPLKSGFQWPGAWADTTAAAATSVHEAIVACARESFVS